MRGNIEIKIENQIPNTISSSYDVEQFQQAVSNVSDLDAIIRGKIRDGIYHCAVPSKLDLYIENFLDDQLIPIIFVCFNAAVSKREEKCAPFFSGKGLSKALKIPFIAIADPVVSSTSLTLAWYAGSSQHKDLQYNLADFLNKIAAKYNARLLIFGASGGGFATLALATLLKCPATIIASNPQTSISQYQFGQVQDYVKQAFPAHASTLNGLETSERSAALYNIFDQCRLIHDVTAIRVPENIKLLYLQNKSDSHVKKHAIPFIQNRSWLVVGNNSIQSGNVAVYFGSWGKGHVNLTKEILLLLLNKLKQNIPLRSVLFSLEEGLDGLVSNESQITFLTKEQYRIYPTISFSGDLINAQCKVKRNGIPFTSSELQYAFYLMDGSQCVASRPYSASDRCTFLQPSQGTDLYLHCFVQDNFKQVMSRHRRVTRLQFWQLKLKFRDILYENYFDVGLYQMIKIWKTVVKHYFLN